MRRIFVLALVIFAVLVYGSDSEAQSGSARGPEVDQTPYALAGTLLHTLSLAASARDVLAETGRSTGSPISDSLNAIVTQRAAVARLREALILVEPFLGARDEDVNQAAKDLTRIYKELAERLLSGVVIWERLARTKTVDDIAALVPESGQNAAEIQEAWRLLPLGVASVSHALVNSGRLAGGKLSYLRLTREEIAQLRADVATLFPTVKPEQKGGQIVDVSVNLFRGFLNGGWKASDDQ